MDKLKYIHHISDIQIRNLKRHKEYNEVFERTYREIEKYKDDAVVYIGGDIAHSKTDMSPELIKMLSDLFVNLADICPTILIAGNHDCNLNNLNRLDVLSPIVDNLKHPNLLYYKKSGIYPYADVNFVVWDVWEDSTKYLQAKDVPGDNKILLFHGTVDKSETDLGFKLPSDVKMSQMKGYDLVLLGDIHKRQFMNKAKTIAYCGSLVQQNHGEELGHGYLRWDVPTRKSTYVEVPNDYGYYTLDIDKGVVPSVTDMPKKARLRLRVKDTTSTKLKKAMKEIRDTYGIEEMTVTRTDRLLAEDKVRSDAINIGDVHDENYRFSLIDEYLKNNFMIDDDTSVGVSKINKYLQDFLKSSDVTRNLRWKIKKFEFSNMFSYGEDNSVDFSKLNGIVGLFALNASGKSSLLDALTFCLYDKSSRAPRAKNVLNNKKETFHCKAELEIDGKPFFIERKAKLIKRTQHVKVDVDFWTVDDSGDKISLNDEQRRTTDVNIRKYIGTYDDFILTTMSLQNNNTVFIDKTQKERKELMAQFMGLGVFDELYVLANQEVNEIQAILKEFEKSDYDVELSDIDKETKRYKKDLVEVEKNIIDLEKDLTDKEQELLSFTKQLKNIDETLDIKQLEKEYQDVSEELDKIDEEHTEANNKIEWVDNTIDNLESDLEDIGVENVEEQFNKLSNLKSQKHEIKVEIDKLKIDVQNKLDKIKKLGDLQYDPECDYCMDNVFVKDAIKTQDGLQTDKKNSDELVKKFDDVVKQIDELTGYEDKKDSLDKIVIELNQFKDSSKDLESKVSILSERITSFSGVKEVLDEKIEKYYKLESDMVFNEKIHDKIEDAERDLVNWRKSIKILLSGKSDMVSAIARLDSKKETIDENVKKIKKLESRYSAYKYFIEAVQRDGIPYELISKALPVVEGAVNDILAQIVDFQILFEMDGKNINCHIVYDEDNVWPLELSSGMERFISSLAIRVGLINVSNLPASDFLAIDEGWGTMDSENLNSVYNLFQFLKSQFKFTMIISHIDTMRDAVDTLLDIKKVDGFSSVSS